MSSKRQIIPIAGLLGTVGLACYMVIQLGAQATPNVTGDFRNAGMAEIRDAQGRTVLQGQFAVIPEDDDDIERKATLKPTGVDTDAKGEAEVEYAKTGDVNQEVEFTATGLDPGATFTCVIDGQTLATVTADKGGKAEVELEVKLSSPSASR
jgi:hypothetical protein